MAWLVELLLPLRDPEGRSCGAALGALKRELTERFGGVTAYTRVPAEGLWAGKQGAEADDIVLVEVLADDLDRAYWGDLRARLETALKQQEVLIRTHPVERL